MSASQNRFALWPFLAWLVLFYTSWLGIVFLGNHLSTVLAHWPMALAMAAGSYLAGSTPMGGGTVGFPVLVLMMDLPATLGRDFSFAVQAIGMTSASIYILCTRQPLEWPMLRAALPGVLIGAPLGILLIAPVIGDLFIKLLFATLWCSFGVLHLRHMREICDRVGITPVQPAFDRRTGFLIGLFGSTTIASVTGVGIDMLLYMILVLLCHADLRIAIPTSVILMAFTSVVGAAVKLLIGDFQPGTFENWLAAAPVVAIGAPLGALVVSRMGRRSTLMIVSVLCVAQFAWTLYHERDVITGASLAASLAGVVLFLLVFEYLRRAGNRLERRSAAAGRGPTPS
jgi:uncharacterized membrane protein YfcA